MVEDLATVRDRRIEILQERLSAQDDYIEHLKRSAVQSLDDLQASREEIACLKKREQQAQFDTTYLRDLANTAQNGARELRHHLSMMCNQREKLVVHLIKRSRLKAQFSNFRLATQRSNGLCHDQLDAAIRMVVSRHSRSAAIRIHFHIWCRAMCQSNSPEQNGHTWKARTLSEADVFRNWAGLLKNCAPRNCVASHPASERRTVFSIFKDCKRMIVAKQRLKQKLQHASGRGRTQWKHQLLFHWRQLARRNIRGRWLCSVLLGKQSSSNRKEAFACWRTAARSTRKCVASERKAGSRLKSRCLQLWTEWVNLSVSAKAILKKATGHSTKTIKERMRVCFRRWAEEAERKLSTRWALQTALQGTVRPSLEAAFKAMKGAVRRLDALVQAAQEVLDRRRREGMLERLHGWGELVRVRAAKRGLQQRQVARSRARRLRRVFREWSRCTEEASACRSESNRFFLIAAWRGPLRNTFEAWASVLHTKQQDAWVSRMASICALPTRDGRMVLGRAARAWRRAAAVRVWLRTKLSQAKARTHAQHLGRMLSVWSDAVVSNRQRARATARARRRSARRACRAWADGVVSRRRTRVALARHAARRAHTLANRCFCLWTERSGAGGRARRRPSTSGSESSESDCDHVTEESVRRLMSEQRARMWGLGQPPKPEPQPAVAPQAGAGAEAEADGLGEVRRLQACLVESASRKERLLAHLLAPEPAFLAADRTR